MMELLKARFWDLAYCRWRTRKADLVPGYSILLPVPHDMPVFLKLALQVCNSLFRDDLVEILVIPDRPTTQFVGHFEAARRVADLSQIRLVVLRPLDRGVTWLLNNPGHNHWLQLINGIEAARSSHLLLHDADLFITDPELLWRQYHKCVDGNLSVMGIDPAAPHAGPWFWKRGIHHIVATYEMMFEVAWARTFSPSKFRAHDMTVLGERTFGDTAYYPMAMTAPERAKWESAEGKFIHFSYVISNYRRFQSHVGQYEDDFFKLLLVRLLIDAFDPNDQACTVPTARALAFGLHDRNAQVTYVQPQTRARYFEFRQKLDCLLTSGLLAERQIGVVRDDVRPFDVELGWSAKEGARGRDGDPSIFTRV